MRKHNQLDPDGRTAWEKRQYDEMLARNMRKLCKGAFGSMGTDEHNHRVMGTSGLERR